MVGHNASLSDDFIKASGTRAKNTRSAIASLIASVTKKEQGIALIIDELGKYLEDGNNDNCYFLQELAEAANRSHTKFLVLGILHQAFDAYASRLPKSQQEEWAKVQGRYVDIPLLAGSDEILQLLQKSVIRAEGFEPQSTEKNIQLVLAELAKTRKIDFDQLREAFVQTWPLNPVTSIILGTVSRKRFLQNSRSVFSFLTSKEPCGFNAFLESEPARPNARQYSLAMLWDYLRANFEQSILASDTDSHRWLLACDCIERTERLDNELAINLIKTIAVLDLFRRGTGLETTRNIIYASMFPVPPAKIDLELEHLVAEKILLERKFLNAFTLFEGSDFNLEDTLAEARNSIDFLNLGLLRELLKLSPLIARKHYSRTGTLRWFSRELIRLDDLSEYLENSTEDGNETGKLLLCIPDSKQIDLEEMSRSIKEVLGKCDSKCVFVGLASSITNILECAIELQALATIAKDPALEGDATARREIAARESVISNQLSNILPNAFIQATWFDADRSYTDINSIQALNNLASNTCDRVYYATPIINNELINREQLSSNITSARRRLMSAMIEHGCEARLGFSAFPPEAMIYVSVLRENHLHQETEFGYRFLIDAEQGTFARLWKVTDDFLKTQQKPTLQEIYELWGRPPFGIKSGIKPILALTYFLARIQNISVYVNDVFQPEVDIALLDQWLLDAGTVAFRFVEGTNTQEQLLRSLQKRLSNEIGKTLEATPLSLSRSLVREVLTCPKWALVTSQMSETTKEFRTAVIKAWDPLELIYKDLSNIFKSDDPDTIAQRTIRALSELKQITPSKFHEIHNILLKALDADENLNVLNKRAKQIKGLAGILKTEAFIGRIETYDGSPRAIESIIGLAVAKPNFKWTDSDLEQAITQIDKWGLEFRHLESLASLRNRQGTRRMISIVVGNEAGGVGKIVDVPAEKKPEMEETKQALSKLLEKLPKETALAALIDISQDYLKD